MLKISAPEISFAMQAVRIAAGLAQRVQTGMAMKGLTKKDLSPVTVADFAIQAVVARMLQQTFPSDGLVGEETAADLRVESGREVRKLVTEFAAKEIDDATESTVCDWIDLGRGEATRRFWTIDPIDGTKGYLRGDQYAVALALVQDGVVTHGALACPRLDTQCKPDDLGGGALLIASRGQGAWCGPLEGGTTDLRELLVSEQADPKQARLLRSLESGHTNVDEVDAVAEALGVEAPPVRMDSQAKYAVLAAGGGELLLRLISPSRPDYKECIWDQAAGSIILEEAGGKITDLNGKPLDFTQGRHLRANTGVLATNGLLHKRALQAVQQVCKVGA